MSPEANVCEKSLGPVTSITGVSPVDCDGYHGLLCDPALSGQVWFLTMSRMPPTSQLFPGTAEGPSSTSAETPASSDDNALAHGVRRRPLQVTWEITRPNGWKGAAARTAKGGARDLQQFSTAEAFHLIDEVAEMHIPLLALTGGDPLARPDLFPVIEFASKRSVRTSLTLFPTPAMEPGIISELKECGLMRAGFWLHGSTASLHDSYASSSGAHRRTLELIGACHEAQLPVQVNTLVSRRNFHNIDSMIELLTRLDVMLWNVFFQVPASGEDAGQILTAREHEEIFAKLYQASEYVHFQIKTTEGQHYQRYLLQQRVRESRGRLTEAEVITCALKSVNDGKGSVFINHRGEAYPSRYLPLAAGDVTRQPLSEVYRDSPLFVSLRDPSRLNGKCGRCPARSVCGGSRARAYAMTGDLFASDPCCAFEP